MAVSERITLEMPMFLRMLRGMSAMDAILLYLEIRGGMAELGEVLTAVGCGLSTLNNTLGKLKKTELVTLTGSMLELNSDRNRTDLEPKSDRFETEIKPKSNRNQTDLETGTEPKQNSTSDRNRTDLEPKSGTPVQDEENGIPSQAHTRIGVAFSSLASKEVLKTTSKSKEIQTPREEKKSRAAKTELPEIPNPLPSDLAQLEGVTEAWNAYEGMRSRHKKHPKLSNFGRDRLWKTLRKFLAEQHDLVEVIAKAEGKGWTDFFRPDTPREPVKPVARVPSKVSPPATGIIDFNDVEQYRRVAREQS